MNLKIPIVFPVATKEINSPVYQGHGSAFFIDANGLFVTAAHTFKNPFRENYALINGERLEITRIWSEYTDFDYQQPQIYKDLFIGRVKNFDSLDFYQLEGLTTDLPAGTVLTLEGYHQHPKPIVQVVVELDELYDDVISDEYQGMPSLEDEKAGLLRLDPIVLTYLKQCFKHIDKYATLNKEFTNGFSIWMEAKEPHGHSGGPLLYQGKVAGMLIGENAAISAEYIKEKLDLHMAIVQGGLTERPAIAVPVSAENEWLEHLIASVHHKLNVPGSRYEAERQNLSFVSVEDFALLKNKPKDSAFSGPAITHSNYCLDNVQKTTHLIIINPNICKEAGLSFPELEAVVMHEIGHVLNMYEKKYADMYTSLDAESLRFYNEEIKRIGAENILNEELYADDYVRQQGFVLPLIGSMKKYLNTRGAENVDLMHKRIQYFENGNNTDLVGVVNILR